MKEFDKRQVKIVKYNVGLSKYSRNTPLLNALRIKKITHLYYEHKINFLKHLKNNELSKRMNDLGFERLNDLNKFSFAKQIKEVSKIIGIDIY